MPSCREQRGVAERDAPCPSTLPSTPCAGDRRRSRAAAGERQAARLGARDDRRRRADARCRARGWRRAAAAPARPWPGSAGRRRARGLPTVRVPVLSMTRVSTLRKASSASASRISTPGAGAAAGGDHDRHRRGEAEGAGAGDDQDRDGGDERVGERAAPGRTATQATKASSATAMTAGTNQAATRSASAWIGARERCALGDQLRRSARASCRRRRARAAMTKLPVPLTVPPVTASPARLLDRHRLAGQHDLVDGARPFDDDAVDRHLLARADAQAVADADLRRAARRPRGRRRRCGGRSRARGPSSARIADAGALAGAELEDLAEEDEDDDDRRGLEVDGDLAVWRRGSRREQPGREDRDEAEQVGRGDAERDQAEHVEAAARERAPATHEERPAAPEDDRRREHQLQPAAAGRDPVAAAGRASAPIAMTKSGTVSAAPTAKRRRKSASSGFGVVGGGRRRARAPCRRSGSRRGRPARSRDASGRCRPFPPAGAGAGAGAEVGARDRPRSVALQPAEQK